MGDYDILQLEHLQLKMGRRLMNAKNDPFPAHIRRTDKTEVRQSVSDHNRQTGQYAWDALAVVNLGGVAKLAGLLHDMGKYTARYRKYIEDAVSGVNPVVRGSVNVP